MRVLPDPSIKETAGKKGEQGIMPENIEPD